MISITCLRPAICVSVGIFLFSKEVASLACQLAEEFIDVRLGGGLEESMGGEESQVCVDVCVG